MKVADDDDDDDVSNVGQSLLLRRWCCRISHVRVDNYDDDGYNIELAASSCRR